MPRKTAIAALLLSSALLLLCLAVSALVWRRASSRPKPQPAARELFKGVKYRLEVRKEPRPMLIHIITINLDAEGIRFLVTPGDPDKELPLKARTTTQFLNEFNLQLAVNGDTFQPWRSNTIFDYYPHRGDPVAPVGMAASEGTIYSYGADAEPVLYLSRTNQARFNIPIGKVYNAISGNLMLIEQGKPLAGLEDIPQPRTAIALDKAGKRLLIVVVDGRQPNYSQGATLDELASILLENGGHFGMNLDGGGSTTLAVQGRFGRPTLLNSPIAHQIPGWQRPVGNHLGIFAHPIKDEE